MKIRKQTLEFSCLGEFDACWGIKLEYGSEMLLNY